MNQVGPLFRDDNKKHSEEGVTVTFKHFQDKLQNASMVEALGLRALLYQELQQYLAVYHPDAIIKLLQHLNSTIINLEAGETIVDTRMSLIRYKEPATEIESIDKFLFPMPH